MPTQRGIVALPGCVRHAIRARDTQHIAGKPVELMRELVKICEPGGLVLDPFSGSASTGVACLAEGYRFIGIELSRVHDRVGRERMRTCSTTDESPYGFAAR